MAISTELIDNLTTSAVNIVYFGFEITAGILDYVRANYVEAFAGLIVLAALLALVWGASRRTSPLSEVKSMTKF
jgi:phosphoglycerol transferase MdoB-like AlkP superfamily enzyme